MNASEIGASFSTVFNTAPFDKLTFVNKGGFHWKMTLKKTLSCLIVLSGRNTKHGASKLHQT